MQDHEPDPHLSDFAAHLRGSAEDITDEWLAHLQRRLGVRPRRLLPTDELRDHVPNVLANASEAMEAPLPHPSGESVDILRSLAQLRREQGYDIEELLVEFDILNDIVLGRAARWAAEAEPELSGGEALRLARRLNAVMRSLAAVAVGTYRDEDVREGRELASGLSDFAATLAHELRNPLSVADMSAELLSNPSIAEDPEKRAKHAERIRDRLERIRQLLEDVSTLAAAEDARSGPRWQPVTEVVARVFEEVRASAERHVVDLSFEEPDEDFQVDSVRIEVALINLVGNGVKFCDPDKEDRWVRVTCGRARSEDLGDGYRISVSDNGRGIDPVLGRRVFDRFFRGHPEIDGTGLGLQITRRLVEQLGGRVWFDSEPGTGTTFHIEFRKGLDRDPSDEGIEQR